MKVELDINKEKHAIDVEPRVSLLDLEPRATAR